MWARAMPVKQQRYQGRPRGVSTEKRGVGSTGEANRRRQTAAAGKSGDQRVVCVAGCGGQRLRCVTGRSSHSGAPAASPAAGHSAGQGRGYQTARRGEGRGGKGRRGGYTAAAPVRHATASSRAAQEAAPCRRVLCHAACSVAVGAAVAVEGLAALPLLVRGERRSLALALEPDRLGQQVRRLDQLRHEGRREGRRSAAAAPRAPRARQWAIPTSTPPQPTNSSSSSCSAALALMGLLASTTEPSAVYSTGAACPCCPCAGGAAAAAAIAARLPVLTG